jgi:hypothetical protein
MWEISGWIAWVVSAIIFIWLAYDFIRVNLTNSEAVLTSSREGVDELFPDQSEANGRGHN